MKGKFALPGLICALAAGCGGSPAETAGSAASALTALPLQHGYYVASDTACGDASNATLMLVSADGINSSRTFCDYASVEQTGATQYRVALSCTDINGDPPETLAGDYDIPDPGRFSYVLEGSDDRAGYRHCEQASLPDPWRDNDLGD
jgi:hypothetical protein